MKDIDRSEKLEPAGSDMKETFAILFFGLAAAAVLIYHMGILDYDALTVLFIVPIIMLATAKGFRYGALLSVICGAMFGTLILLRILQGKAGSGFILHNVGNLAIIVGFGLSLGIVAEYFRFGMGEQWRMEPTIVETFVPDEETGLYNFKSFRWMLRGDINRVKRYDNPLSVVFLRLNKFHEFTDSHERIEEVRLLREVGRSLRSILREADYIGRYSDDEIGVALPETNRAGCEKALERIREKKQDLTDLLRAQWKDFDGRLHISFASFPKDAKGLEELVDVIDARYTEL